MCAPITKKRTNKNKTNKQKQSEQTNKQKQTNKRVLFLSFDLIESKGD